MQHELMYPNYKFQPKRKEEKAAQRAAKQAERARDKELKNAAAGGNRRRRARSPAADGDHHPYAHGMGRTSSYMGSSHPPEHRVGGLYRQYLPSNFLADSKKRLRDWQTQWRHNRTTNTTALCHIHSQ